MQSPVQNSGTRETEVSTFRFGVLLAASALLALPWLVLPRLAIADDVQRVALVVGNAAYAHAPVLRNPRNDANDIANALDRLDFDVMRGLDLDRNAFFHKLDAFTEAARGADVALFFYAGHGLQVDGRNYLAPVDARLSKKLHLRSQAIDLDTVMDEMNSPTNLVFLDACRDNPLAGNLARSMGLSRSAGSARGLARVEDQTGTLIAYATSPGTVADDGAGANSPFTAALLEHIATPGLSIFDLVNEVSNTVRERTHGTQIPWSHYSALPNRFPLLPERPRPSGDFAVEEVDRVMWATGPSNARSGPGTSYDRIGSIGASEEVTVTGEVADKPWVRIEMKGGKSAYVHERQLIGQRPQPAATAKSPGIYLTFDVSAGQRILREHLQAIGADRIPAGDIRAYSMVAGGCYAGARSAGVRLDWSDISARCSQ